MGRPRAASTGSARFAIWRPSGRRSHSSRGESASTGSARSPGRFRPTSCRNTPRMPSTGSRTRSTCTSPVSAMAAEVVVMVARATTGWGDAAGVAAQARALSARLVPLASADATAFARVVALRADPHADERDLGPALDRAAELPLAIADAAAATAELAAMAAGWAIGSRDRRHPARRNESRDRVCAERCELRLVGAARPRDPHRRAGGRTSPERTGQNAERHRMRRCLRPASI